MVQTAHFLGSGQILALPMHRGAYWGLVGAFGLVNRAMITGSNGAEVRLFTMTGGIKSREYHQWRRDVEAEFDQCLFFFSVCVIPEVSIWVIDNALHLTHHFNLDIKWKAHRHPN